MDLNAQHPVQTAQQDDQEQGGAAGVLWRTVAWVRDIAASTVIAIFVILFLYQPVKVEGTSMQPSIEDQERIFINKFVYRVGSVERGDLVVFWSPVDPTRSYIKRVAALPGDVVEIDHGKVMVNHQAVEEPYVPDQFRDHYSMAPMTVPTDCYFVLGDHRSSSNDSRNWGAVHRQAIYGKAVFSYWPPEKLGILH